MARASAATDYSPMAVPAATYFAISAVFHYLGPAFAVLLFRHVDVLGVAWLRIATAALVFAVWRRPWRHAATLEAGQRQSLVALGVVLAAMNTCFYLAIDRLPLGTVGAIEFLGIVALAVAGVRTARNVAALVLAVAGVVVLSDYRWSVEPWAWPWPSRTAGSSCSTSCWDTASPRARTATVSIGWARPCWWRSCS